MITPSLKRLGPITFVIILLLFSPFVYNASSAQRVSALYTIYQQPGRAAIELYSDIFAISESQNTPLLYSLIQELHVLPVGRDYNYYLQVLEQRGYLILENYNDDRHWDFTLEKRQQNLRLTIAYNSTTGKSTTLTASGPRIAVVAIPSSVPNK